MSGRSVRSRQLDTPFNALTSFDTLSVGGYLTSAIRFAGIDFRVWDSYGLADYAIRAGAFVEDARRRWYFTVAVALNRKPDTPAMRSASTSA